MHPTMIRVIGKVSTYLPLGLTIVLLIITSFDSDLLRYVPLELMVAISGLSFILIAVHIEAKLTATADKLDALSSNVRTLSDTHRAYLDAAAPTIQTMSLASSFATVSSVSDTWKHLRIYAITSGQIMTFFKEHRLRVERCEILVHSDPRVGPGHNVTLQLTPYYVQDWRDLQREGWIGSLVIRSYNFLPTEFECIFDDRIMILGLYHSDPDHYSQVQVGSVTVVSDNTLHGHQMINAFRSRYDKLFAICATNHGPNPYEN